MPDLLTFLTYDDQAEEAARFYCSVFPDAEIGRITRFGAAGPGPKGAVQTIEFELAGREFVALNGGPQFQFSDGISISVQCDTQDEIDRYWDALSKGGEALACGWLRDRWGVAWQVNPKILLEMLADPDPEKAKRAFDAMLQMTKIDIATLQRAVSEKG